MTTAIEPTWEDWEQSYDVMSPESKIEIAQLTAAARAWRVKKDHVAAGALDKRIAAIYRMEHKQAAEALAAVRVADVRVADARAYARGNPRAYARANARVCVDAAAAADARALAAIHALAALPARALADALALCVEARDARRAEARDARSAADAADAYLDALDEAEDYCTPPDPGSEETPGVWPARRATTTAGRDAPEGENP